MLTELAPQRRLGLHYYPDTNHYRDHDLQIWLPELRALGAAWLTLIAPIERAIPEAFLRGLISEGIEPVLHFPLVLSSPEQVKDLSLLFSNYARWGVRYAVLFDRPNRRRNWAYSAWPQSNLVERFLDQFLPLADEALKSGLIPVLPPLEPGGDYWDTAFLQTALKGIQRRGQAHLLDALAISAYAWTYHRSLNWGVGGPERWPNAQPYHTPTDSQDQIGFRIFDWYNALTQAELGSTRPILILRAGSQPGELTNHTSTSDEHKEQTINTLSIVQQLELNSIRPVESPKKTVNLIQTPATEILEPLPQAVTAVNFWLLTAEKNSPDITSAWYQPDGSTLPVVSAMKQWISTRSETEIQLKEALLSVKSIPNLVDNAIEPPRDLPIFHPIDHYLLLPLYAWGVADWDLDSIRPLIQKFHPTVGFSIHEACLASRVTIVGSQQLVSPETLEMLQSAGCSVERLDENGTLLAI